MEASMPRFMPNLAALACALAVSACGIFGGPSAPEPEYDVLRSQSPFEIRAYQALAVASTPMGAGLGEGTGGAFRRLFDYISGDNRGDREVAMTAPVIQQPAEGREIEMTAPVLQKPDGGGGWNMLFVLPAGLKAETAPVPTDGSVRVGMLPARRVAVIRFDGFLSDANAMEARDRLLAWMRTEGLAPAGPAEIAGYNPPWTLPWFRRNEILIPVEAG
jgi:hypothetical protein